MTINRYHVTAFITLVAILTIPPLVLGRITYLLFEPEHMWPDHWFFWQISYTGWAAVFALWAERRSRR